MATILFSAAGAAIGGAFGGTAFGLSTAVLGRAIGATVGRAIDQRLLGAGSEVVETGRIERFQLTGASEGAPVGALYGRIRVGGQVIWATKFKEHVEKEEVGGKGGGGSSTTTKTFSYSVSLAIALCEGEILGVGRIWADGQEIERSELDMRVYKGSDHQLPDPKIAAVEGYANAPAYRGLAYVVLENLEIAAFGNRVPQFTFEVMRATDSDLVPPEEKSLSDTIKAVALIPGTGEYALATTKVSYGNDFGWSKTANVNSGSGRTDFQTSLRQLNDELPKCRSVSLVVSWFGNDLRCGHCRIAPKVEQDDFEGRRMDWRVSGLSRPHADEVARIDGRSVYGGTPADEAVVESIQALRASGKSVVFYPFILMEQLSGNTLTNPWTGATGQPACPWRGRITTERAPGVSGTTDRTGAARAEVESFFGLAEVEDFTINGVSVDYAGPSEWSFRRFIIHYAHLCKAAGGVDAFCIGTEMRALTQIRGAGDTFPAVEQLVRLAQDVRGILGPDTKLSYAADWSEYFGYQPSDGSGDVYFHLDPLWASDDIDFVGIDNYMPLSDWREDHQHADSGWGSIYNLDYLKANVAGGEGYDWYYASANGRASQERLPITDGAHGEPWVFRYKDIRNWWRNRHHERRGGVRQSASTAWVSESKPIWFTEVGCAAIDKGTNQPNKFLDPKSSESTVPWFSSGVRDDLIQMQYIRATCQYWQDAANNPLSSVYGGRMVDYGRTHVWAWDLRPYPDFPIRSDIWSDGDNYTKGHWLNGRVTSQSLAAVVADICARSGVRDVDVSKLYGLVRGYCLEEVGGARAALQTLSLAFGFDASEAAGKLVFRTRTGLSDLAVDKAWLVDDGEGVLNFQRAAVSENVGKVRLSYTQCDGNFETRTAEASFPDQDEVAISGSDLPICLTAAEGRRIAERWLAETRIGRDTASFSLPPSLGGVAAGNVVQIHDGQALGNYRVDRIESGEAIRVDAVRVESATYRPPDDVEEPYSLEASNPVMPVFAQLLDLPMMTGDEDPVAPYLAVAADPWPGSVSVFSSSEDDGYSFNTEICEASIVGTTKTPLPCASPGLLDRGSALRIRISGGVLASTTRSGLLNGANAMAIGDGNGDWEVFQFREAVLVAPDTYEVRERLRGQLGTDAVMPEVWPVGSRVVLLDGGPKQLVLSTSARGLERHYRIGPSSRGYGDESYEHLLHTAKSVGLRPLSPVHLRTDRLSDGALSFRWIRRTRIDGDSWEGMDVPLGEETERYLLQVVAGGAVRREVTTNDCTWLYSADMQTEDELSGSFEVQVAQISERFGAGPFQRIEIDE